MNWDFLLIILVVLGLMAGAWVEQWRKRRER